MYRMPVFLAVLFAVTSTFARGPSAAVAPNAALRPLRPRAPVSQYNLAPVPVTDSPPPFGTVVQEWELEMSGSYAGAGITWRRDSGRFYLADQGYVGQPGVWSCDPFDPPGSLRRENWVIPNMGTDTTDIPWSIAWDGDSNCFWISDIVDGNVYGGCYYIRIRQTPVGDTWRWFNQFPGDTWLVGTGQSGGPGNMYWMSGSEKWKQRSCFVCAPVAPTGQNNHVWKFDPYTKTSYGKCPNGSSASDRGCTLVPWDSNYILTAGWTSSNRICKRDSTGLGLDSAEAIDVADIAVWVPQVIRPDDTVFMYSIVNNVPNTLQKRSLGMLWRQLPSISPNNVCPTAILAPRGSVDSGQTVTPDLVVENTGTEPAHDVKACFAIDINGTPMYADSIAGLSLDAGARETLRFTDWTPRLRDSLSVTAWTSWSGDSFPGDDTIRNRFLVRVRDIAIPWYRTDKDTYDSGEVITAHARAENRGNQSLNFDIRFRYRGYQSTRNLNLIAGGATLVAPPVPFGGYPPGVYFLGTAEAVVTGDLVPDNNFAACTARVRGPISHDYAVLRILEPTGEKDTLTPVAPSALIANLGREPDSAAVTFGITFGDSVVMHNTAYCRLSPGDSAAATFSEIRFTEFGTYVAACSVRLWSDQNFTNDEKLDTFEVAPVGVTDGSFIVPRLSFTVTPNPATSGFLTLSFTGPLDHLTTGPLSLSLFDISGRPVLRPAFGVRSSPLRLDLRSLPAGVYMLRVAAGANTYSQKVILQH